MAIKKRIQPKAKPRRKLQQHSTRLKNAAVCDDLYNRLQQGRNYAAVMIDLAAAAGWGSGNPLDYLERILGCFTSNVRTWGFYADDPQYEVTLVWHDYSRKRYGVPHRVERKTTSHDLLQAATLTYIAISRELGFFP